MDSNPTLKFAIAVALLRSKLFSKQSPSKPSSSSSSSSLSVSDAQRWKTKAKERKLELIKIKQDLKELEVSDKVASINKVDSVWWFQIRRRTSTNGDSVWWFQKTVSNLKLEWEFVAGGDISATPAIFEKTVYFPCWNEFIYAVKASDGSLVWAKNLTELTGLEPSGFVFGVNFSVSRATPTIAGDLVLFGIYRPAIVIAVKRATGALVWSTRFDNSNASVLTQSGTVFKRHFYVGTSSLEETVSIEQCCKFRGSMVKLDVQTGVIKWQTYTLPDNFGKLGEYAGAAIWGSSPSIDKIRNLVYVATYNVPYEHPLFAISSV